MAIDDPGLERRLREAVQAEDMIEQFGAITEELKASAAGIDSAAVIFRFIEEHPRLDIGMPGPLVHYLERFEAPDYDRELLASLRRRPTVYTVWMLNRLINATKDEDGRGALIDALRAAGEHPEADEDTRSQVSRFLKLQTGE